MKDKQIVFTKEEADLVREYVSTVRLLKWTNKRLLDKLPWALVEALSDSDVGKYSLETHSLDELRQIEDDELVMRLEHQVLGDELTSFADFWEGVIDDVKAIDDVFDEERKQEWDVKTVRIENGLVTPVSEETIVVDF